MNNNQPSKATPRICGTCAYFINDPKTGQAKRRKHERELNFVAYTSATIHNSLNNPNHEKN